MGTMGFIFALNLAGDQIIFEQDTYDLEFKFRLSNQYLKYSMKIIFFGK